MSNEFWEEVFRLVKDFDAQRPKVVKEYRLYYDEKGNVTELWETGHPPVDNYIVLDDPSIFYNNNSSLLKVKDKKLIVLDSKIPNRTRLQKGKSEFRVVKGHAALLLEPDEDYQDIEYYDRTNN
jgi:hypothetical protein